MKADDANENGRAGAVGSGVWLGSDDLALIQGALDSMGCALADHGHEWSDGERAVYEEGTKLLSFLTSIGCMGSDSSETARCLSPRLSSKCRLRACRVSIRSLVSEYSLWRVALAAALLSWSSVCRRFVWICSWCCGGEKSSALPNV